MAREVALLWVEEGLEPLTSRLPGRIPHDDLCAAVAEALRDEEGKKAERKLPWIRAGSGSGAAVFNIQAIRLLSELCPTPDPDPLA